MESFVYKTAFPIILTNCIFISQTYLKITIWRNAFDQNQQLIFGKFNFDQLQFPR